MVVLQVMPLQALLLDRARRRRRRCRCRRRNRRWHRRCRRYRCR